MVLLSIGVCRCRSTFYGFCNNYNPSTATISNFFCTFAPIMRYCLWVICLLLNIPVWSHQQGDTLLLDMRSGLSESRVRSIRQMPDGRIAIATTTTIDIFDGTRFLSYPLPPDEAYPLPEYMGNRQMNCDTTGLIWLINKHTLYVVDSRREPSKDNPLKPSAVKVLMRQRGLTHQQVIGFKHAPPPPTPLTWEGVFRDETVTAYTRDTLGGLWIGTLNYGVLYINPQRMRQFQTTNTSFPYEPQPAFCSSRASILSTRLSPSGTNCSYDEGERYLYLGTLNGLLVIDSCDSLIATINETDGLLTNNVVSITADHDGRLWAATASGGISCIHVNGRDSFDIMNYGLLEGINLDGREFLAGQIRCDSTGMITVGFAGGTVRFCSDSVGRQQYVYRWPRKKTGTSDTDEASSWWYWLLIPLVVGIAYWLMRSRKKQKPIIAAKPAPATTSDAIVERLKNIETPSQDEQFLKKLHQVVEQNIDNEDFSVQQLSEEMAMDRTVLYRRMQALDLGTPSAYIKHIRMEVAARLLRETELPINEIALRTGFANAKYFSIAFKQEFGKSPRAFRELATSSMPVLRQ